VDLHREIELKLDASAGDLRRLSRLSLVRSLSQARAVTQKLESVYFDTEDHDLAAANFGLRVRRAGRRRIQTLKGERSASGGLFERSEFETAISGEEPSLAWISDAELRARLIARRVGDDAYAIDIVLAGDGETPFFDDLAG